MREIKFRCFYRGIMYPVKEMSFSPDHSFSVSVIEMDLEGLGIRNVSPDSEHIEGIMQFTGLHDKNGKEIFEGDIVRYYLPGETDQDPNMEFTEEVSFVDGCFVVDGYTPAYVTTDWNVEVVGNIYQDSELLSLKI